MNLRSHAISLVFVSGFRFTRGTDSHCLDRAQTGTDRSSAKTASWILSPSKRDTEKQIDGTNRALLRITGFSRIVLFFVELDRQPNLDRRVLLLFASATSQ